MDIYALRSYSSLASINEKGICPGECDKGERGGLNPLFFNNLFPLPSMLKGATWIPLQRTLRPSGTFWLATGVLLPLSNSRIQLLITENLIQKNFFFYFLLIFRLPRPLETFQKVLRQFSSKDLFSVLKLRHFK